MWNVLNGLVSLKPQRSSTRCVFTPVSLDQNTCGHGNSCQIPNRIVSETYCTQLVGCSLHGAHA